MATSFLLRPAQEADLPSIYETDDDATSFYATAGMPIELAPEHPFAIAERARWATSVRAGDAFVATEDGIVGFATLKMLDGAPYLDQLSVRRAVMGRGAGSMLVEAAWAWSRARSDAGLWLNTYGHLPWNVPFYARRGFALVPESEWKPAMRAVVEEQRAVLPRPDQRVVMHRR